VSETSGSAGAGRQVAELEARLAALRQAARSKGAEPGELLDAALTELDGAVDLLRAAQAADGEPAAGAGAAERSLLRAAFSDAPVPLFLLARDGTVQRINESAGDLIGSKPGYATGRPFTALVNLPSRAAVQSQLSAVARTGKLRRIRCTLLSADGVVPSELIIGRVGVRGEADQLMVAARDAPAAAAASRDAPATPAASRGAAATPAASRGAPATPAAAGSQGAVASRGAVASPVAASPATAGERPGDAGDAGSRLAATQAITRRLDLVTATATLLLANEGFSESRTLQRCARLIAREFAAWTILDIERGGKLRRQLVLGPDDMRFSDLARAVAAVDPEPGSVPYGVHESARPALIAHAEDAGALGVGQDGEPLLVTLQATSVLSVPLSDGENRYGVLTLVRPATEGFFRVADLALVEGLGEQMALAIRVNRMFRRRSDTADALHGSLLPRRMPEIPGAQVAATYIAAEDPEVGSDFYDVYRTQDGWGLAVGDVCGKGEEAAAVTAAARHAIRVLARRCADPGEVLAGTNEILLADELALDGGFVTANIAHLSWPDSRLRVVVGSAGHPAAALLQADGRVQMLSGGGLPLGLFPDAEPAIQELTMDAGDVLFLYSNGVAQLRGPLNIEFQDRMADELVGMVGYPPDRLVASMRQAMLDFSGGNLVDDVTMLAMRAGRRPQGSPPAARTSAGRTS
jgi:serine phosphatase RsbU (regulator of sigma subunit)/PAS domain-containing protein